MRHDDATSAEPEEASIRTTSHRVRRRRSARIDAEFEARFEGLMQRSYTTAYRILGDAGKSEDVAQEALVRAHQRWTKIESYAEAWIVRVSRNLAIDAWRRIRDEADDEIDALQPDPALGVIEMAAIKAALASIPERRKEAIVLRMLMGLTPEQAAAKMGISVAGVLKHTARGVAELRRLLDPEAHDSTSDIDKSSNLVLAGSSSGPNAS